MTAPQRGLSLRATLRLLAAGALAYVALIAVVIVARIGPTAIALRRYSELILTEYDAIRTRTDAFHATIEDVYPLLGAGAGQDRLAALRARVDTLSAAAAASAEPPGIPTEMRIGLAATSTQETRLGTTLADAIANLELGRVPAAARQLQVADSVARLIDRQLAETQRVGLVDLIGRERALAAAARDSIQAVGWWLALGIVLAPFVAFFLRRRFYEPLTDLESGIARVALGDLEGMIPVRRADELGRVSAHFNETTAVLRQRAEETQRRAQAALQQSEEKFAIAFRSSPNPSVITRLEDGLVVEVNDAYLAATGFSYDEVVCQLAKDVLWPNPEGRGALVAELRATGRVRDLELQMRTKAGPPLDVLVSIETIELDGVPHTLGAAVDITERHRAEEEQRRLKEAVMASAVDWTLTFDAVQSPILILDGDGLVRRLNASARALAGRETYQEATGRTLEELGSGEPWRGLAALVSDVRRTHGPATSQVFEAEARRSWYLTASPFTVSGEEDRVIVTARDVTDLVALQESLRRTETMSALGSLVAGVAHEVRNPLFAISATVDAFEARTGAQEAYARYTKTLRQEVSRLSELMQELLEYGKPPHLELTDTTMQPIVARAIERSAVLADAAGVRVAAELDDGLPALRVDSSRMLQVFQNLIENAIQHSPRGGVVTVRTRLTASPARLEVTVADTGPGFTPVDLPHVFEPFFTRRRGGTGLGLSIVERIVEQHGGEITAGNRPEGGAIVTVRLAIAAATATRLPETTRVKA